MMSALASYSPNDTIEYRHEFQISDFFAEDGFTVTDTISDGQHFDNTFTPTLSINGNTYVLTEADFQRCQFHRRSRLHTRRPRPPNSGETVITFRVSDEIVTRGQPNGYLIGGCVPTTGTGGADPDCTIYNDGPTTGIIPTAQPSWKNSLTRSPPAMHLSTRVTGSPTV